MQDLKVQNSIFFSQSQKLAGLSAYVSERIRGQDRALRALVQSVKRGQWRLTDARRPLGSFLLLGQTGVGKTETINCLSQYIFGSAPIRFDMTEFQHPDTFMFFLGANSNDPGRLGNVLREHDEGFLLFDEIEKSYRELLGVFLQILDAARVTDATGRTYDLRNFYVACTSNIGSDRILDASHLPGSAVEDAVEAALYDHMRPELIPRFDKRLVFMPLGVSTQRQIALDMLEKEVKRLGELGYALTFGSDVVEYVVRKGIHDRSGARPMRGVVEEALQMAVVEQLEDGFETVNGNLFFDRKADRLKLQLVPASNGLRP